MTDQRTRSPTSQGGILRDAVESFDLQPMQDADAGKPRRISGVAKSADAINLNRRFFSLAVLTGMCAAAQDALKTGELYGLVQHPDPWYEGPKGLIQNVGIKYDRLWMDGTLLRFEGVVVATTQGRDLQAVLDAGVKVGMSTNVRGSARYLPAKEVDPDWPDPEETIQVVNDDARLVTIDAVMGPADLAGELNAADSVREDHVKDLAELKAKYPALYDQAVAAGKQEAGANTLEDQLASERTARLALEKKIQDDGRKAIATKALTDANLPKLGKSGDIDLDARFEKRVTDAALRAENEDEARAEVAALIAERKVSTGAAQDEANNPGLDTTTTVQDAKKTTGKSRSTFSAARRSLGL
ncbi:hypothetical protein [Deinococcus sp. JMULE3]|uniref:hypothetical protein n=1 Tax=Deinococcus sp. JMULE3 TaxID=2518341 RepID=UPI001575E9AC|nr:hypothetical protein [Deinococcus sp. JMULE3]NTY02076.1 hypothetical protein [Deinococcus sp. JMULE3]